MHEEHRAVAGDHEVRPARETARMQSKAKAKAKAETMRNPPDRHLGFGVLSTNPPYQSGSLLPRKDVHRLSYRTRSCTIPGRDP